MIRPALGLHPLQAGKVTESDWRMFESSVDDTTYIGEVGLDFSSEGVQTKQKQQQAFRRVLDVTYGRGKVLSLHSRRAETAVLSELTDRWKGPAIFHWYSGSLRTLDLLLAAGHYCSINPAMTRSRHGQRVIEKLPRNRVLAETDGPFVQVGNRPARPTDVTLVHRYLASLWEEPASSIAMQLHSNLVDLLEAVRSASRAG